jgi:hypothetical protein
LCDTNARD